MSLNIYPTKESIPNNLRYMNQNDSWFMQHRELPDNPIVRSILKNIDDCEYQSKSTFVSNKFSKLGGIYNQFLSTGCKTALNVYFSVDDGTCIDTIECGPNAFTEILRLHNGNILLSPADVMQSDGPCDINFMNVHYTNMGKFLEALYRYEENN